MPGIGRDKIVWRLLARKETLKSKLFVMLLKKFALPKTDSRLVTVHNVIYKIKLLLIKHPTRDEKSYEEFYSNPECQEEIEEILMLLFTNENEELLPMKSSNLTVYPYKKPWKMVHKIQFYRDDILLKPYPYEYYLYIESTALPPEKKPMLHHPVSPHCKDGQDAITDSEDETLKDSSNIKKVEPKAEIQQSNEANVFEPAKMCDHPVKRSHDESEGDDNQSTRLNEDNVPLETRKRCKRITLIPASSVAGPAGNKSDEPDEAEPKKFSVTEYLDANRHDVQEQDLREHLRFQELATPADDESAICDCPYEESRSFHKVLSSVKKLMFGS